MQVNVLDSASFDVKCHITLLLSSDEGGTVLIPANSGVFVTGSLWLRSNLTLRVEEDATLM